MFAHPDNRSQRRFVPLWESILGLTALLLPGAGFLWGLTRVSGRPGYVDLSDWHSVPGTLWVIGACGTIATIAA